MFKYHRHIHRALEHIAVSKQLKKNSIQNENHFEIFRYAPQQCIESIAEFAGFVGSPMIDWPEIEIFENFENILPSNSESDEE